MGIMGSGYGSECHLLRYLGRHRELLDRRIRTLTGAQSIAWLDYPFDRGRSWQDGEWRGLDFLGSDAPARVAWSRMWPRSGNAPNCDAVGRIALGSGEAWLLVEAKANLEELRSSCQASPRGGRPMIEAFLERTKQRLGVAAAHDWLSDYYQFCNRVAVLDLLHENGTPAHLLNIYFTGDRSGAGRTCPADASGWQAALEALAEHVGLAPRHPLAAHVHKLFLPVCPPPKAQVGPDGTIADNMAA